MPSDSAYRVHGQKLDVIPPGGSLHTVVVAEEGMPTSCTHEHVWRVQLRCKPDGSTAVIGVRFSDSDVSKPKP